MPLRKTWFGIPGKNMQWVPEPLAGFSKTMAGYSDRVDYENGGAGIVRSVQSHAVYSADFLGYAHEVEGIDAFSEFASGLWGTGKIHFADEMNFRGNVLAPAWASPSLIEQGWRNISNTLTPTFVDTASNQYRQPPRSAVFSITDTASFVPASRHIIVIPPTHTLLLGVSGTRTGTGGMNYRVINSDNTYGSVQQLNLLSPTGAQRSNYQFSGSQYQAIEIWPGRTSTAVSTFTFTSAIGQLIRTELANVPDTPPTTPSTTLVTGPTVVSSTGQTGSVVSISGRHVKGSGNLGLRFADEAIVEEYGYMYPPRKGLSTVLEETWV